jgi:DegV family protein with EDD domain
MNICIITDSAVDLTADLRKEFGIGDYVHGFVVRPDGTQFKADLDWGNVTKEEYFGSMKHGKALYKTATSSTQEVIDLFTKHLQAGEDILGMTIGHAFSGMYDIFVNTAKKVLADFPERKIEIIDTCRYGGAYALLAYQAHQYISQGLSVTEVAAKLNEEKFCTHQMGPLDDLFFLNRSGRVSKTIAVMGTMVGIRPLADFDPNGFCHPIGKVKGANKALECTVQYVKKTMVDPAHNVIFVSNSDRPEEGAKLAALLAKEVKPLKIYETSIGQLTGANLGPGLAAAFYLGNKLSEGCVDETKILADIVAGK